uniref:Lrr-gala family type III effector protein (Gala 7) n=1 Tax=Ganoderma boninense TaxID=34458 RepID=A0A5K1K4H3_9APHY|nr:Lrr-gala family type III effector protein (Gala 7) [Ganoderma boninense]
MTNNSTVNPSEVGWQFVPQYYTFVNKHPNRLHCFYTKASTFIHGTEGEDGKPCLGQAEIHNKITSIGFQDCKVFIHSVDAQSSANGGIIIQVIGEMSNKGEAWKKFVQTFFLAEQPNGYFVLNDIFRFLKEESVEDGDEPEADVTAPTAPDHAPPAPVSPAPPPPAEPEPIPAPVPVPVPAVEERVPSPVPAPSPQPQVNARLAASPAPVSPAPPPPQQLPPPPAAPAQPPQQPPPPAAVPAPAPIAPAPSAPKSWASLAATGAKGWGSAVASQSRGTSEVPAPTSSASPAPGTQSPAPQRPPAAQGHPAYIAAQTVATPQCFVKACAFLEFLSLDAAKRAITASLPVAQGGEGGIRIETDGGAGQARIIVETRKERGERPPPRGPPMNGDRGRGAFRGRGGPGRGRGGPPPKA